jgi:hypothetical protein
MASESEEPSSHTTTATISASIATDGIPTRADSPDAIRKGLDQLAPQLFEVTAYTER